MLRRTSAAACLLIIGAFGFTAECSAQQSNASTLHAFFLQYAAVDNLKEKNPDSRFWQHL
jgi:hypothetical protein